MSFNQITLFESKHLLLKKAYAFLYIFFYNQKCLKKQQRRKLPQTIFFCLGHFLLFCEKIQNH